MSSNHHVPLNGTDWNNIARLNSIFASLDAAITGSAVNGTAGENLSERDMVYLASDGEWYQIDADAVSTVAIGAVRGCVAESGGITNNSTGVILLQGAVSGFSGLTNGGAVYAGTTAGGYTQTRPVVSDGGGQIAIVEMGVAISTSQVYISPLPVIYAERETLADNGTLTIEHHSDPSTRLRAVMAYVATTVAGSSLASYADSNQDEDVGLRDQSVATYGSDLTGSATISSSSEDGSEVDDDAVDDNTSSYWRSNVAPDTTPQWIQATWGASKTIRQYTIQCDSTATTAPSDFTLEYFDGSWQVADTQSSLSWSSSEKKTFTVASANAATQWRVYITSTATGGNKVRINELEMMEAATFNASLDKLAQSFEVTGTQTVETVDLWLKKVGSPTGTMTLRIETDNSGEPSGTLADANLTTTVAESGLGTSYADVSFTFSTPASISGSTTYWMVLSTDRSASESNYVHWGADGSSPGYANGQMMSEASSSWSAESKDAVFEVTGEGTQYDEPLAVGSVTGDSEEMGVRFDDGAGSDGDIKTTFKNLTGASADIVCEVVL